MSQIIWTNSLLPTQGQNATEITNQYYPNMGSLDKFLGIPLTDRDIKIAEPRAFRSMSRAALLLSSACQPCETLLAKYLEKDPFSVGIYAAVENGPIHLETTSQMTTLAKGEFATVYKKLRNPKMYLKQLPNLAPAQMGIFLKVQGPLNVYTHSLAAGIQALEQAEYDLSQNKVEAALVCTSFSFEDPLINARARQDEKKRIVSEAAAAVLLVKNEEYTNWAEKIKTDNEIFYGIADEIVNVVKERETHVK